MSLLPSVGVQCSFGVKFGAQTSQLRAEEMLQGWRKGCCANGTQVLVSSWCQGRQGRSLFLNPLAEEAQRGFWQSHPLNEGTSCCGRAASWKWSAQFSSPDGSWEPDVPSGCCSSPAVPASSSTVPQAVLFGGQHTGNSYGCENFVQQCSATFRIQIPLFGSTCSVAGKSFLTQLELLLIFKGLCMLACGLL